jgi:peptide/nickel transport system substrate-binding protein
MPGSARSTLPMIDTNEVVDPQTVNYHLKTPTPWLLAILGDPWANAVVSKKLVEANTAPGEAYPGEKWLAVNEAGAGPYKITHFEPASRVEYTRDPNWPDWTPGAHLEKVTVINVTEPATQRLMFERGEVDIATDLTPEDVDALVTRSGLTYHDFFTDETLTFNFGDWAGKPWEDKRVRQAFLSSFNFQVAGQLAAGYQQVPCGVPPQLQNFNGCSVQYSYDLDQAKKLLADAGHADGLDITVNMIQGDAIAASLLQMWQADLAKIGVTMNITALPNAVIFPGKVKEPSFYGLGSIYVEPMGWLYFWSRPAPDGFWWYNPWYKPDYPPAAQFRQLVDKAAVEQDNEKRSALYTQAIDIFQNEWVWGHFLQPRRRIVFNQALKGYVGFYRQGTYAVPLPVLSWGS